MSLLFQVHLGPLAASLGRGLLLGFEQHRLKAVARACGTCHCFESVLFISDIVGGLRDGFSKWGPRTPQGSLNESQGAPCIQLNDA